MNLPVNKKNIFLSISIAGIIAFLITLWSLYSFPTYGIDDFRIYLIYMRNIAEGAGPVYNINSEYVEGFSSPLYTLIGTLFYNFFSTHTDKIFLIFNASLYSLLLAYIYKKVRYWKWDIQWTAILILAIGVAASLPFWNVFSLLETALFTLSITVFIISIAEIFWEKKTYPLFFLPILAGLLPWIRPEAYLLVPLALVLPFLIVNKLKQVKPDIKKTFTFSFISFLLSMAILLSLRYMIFGDILPNTYYAKQLPLYDKLYHGFFYIAKFFYHNPIYLLLILAVWHFSSKHLHNNRAKWLASAAIFIPIVLPLISVADHFNGSRFYLPFIPIYTILIILLIRDKYSKFINLRKIPTFLLAVATVLIVFPEDNPIEWTYQEPKSEIEFRIIEISRSIIYDLDKTFPNNKPSIGVISAGEMGYLYDGYVLDLVGLNQKALAKSDDDRAGVYIGHVAFDKDVFLQEMPDIVGPRVTGPDDPRHIDSIDYKSQIEQDITKGLFTDKRFLAHYAPYVITRIPNQKGIYSYFNIEFVNSLNPNQYYIYQPPWAKNLLLNSKNSRN